MEEEDPKCSEGTNTEQYLIVSVCVTPRNSYMRVIRDVIAKRSCAYTSRRTPGHMDKRQISLAHKPGEF